MARVTAVWTQWCLVALLLVLLTGLWADTAQAQPFAYISNSGSNTVSVINTATNTVVATVSVGTNPFGVAMTPDGSRVYVTNEGSNTVSVIDTATNTVTATVPVGDSRPAWR
jgi:YVTN family beta-propeller protein